MNISRYRLWLTALFGLALNLSISASLILSALLLVDWGIRSKDPHHKLPWKSSAVDWAILIFFLWTTLTAAVFGTESIWEAIRTQSAFLLFYWAAHSQPENELHLLFQWLCIGAAVAGAHGLLQQFSGVNYLPSENVYIVPDAFANWPKAIVNELSLRNERAVGPRNHPLTYAESFIPGFFLLLCWILSEWKSQRRSPSRLVWLVVAFLIIVAGIVLAQGRAVWLGLGMGILAFGATLGTRNFVKTVGILTMLLLPLFVFGSPQIRGRLMSIVSPTSGSLGDQQSKSTRFTLWREAWNGIRAHPYTGIGFKGAKLQAVDPISRENRIWTETHNMFLQVTLEMGVIGLGLFLWVLYGCGRFAWSAAPPWRSAFVGIFVTFMVAGLTETWPRDKEIALLFWTLMGAAASLRTDERV